MDKQAYARYANQTLKGGFRTGKLIGAGGFAWVYDAVGPDGKPCAVKVLYSPDPQARRRFAREVEVCRELPPNIHVVGYRGHGETPDGLPFLAMELVNGGALKEFLASGKRASEKDACRMMLQICESFVELHKLGLAHRDVKPDNILIDSAAGLVKLLDFGLVKDAQGLLKLFEEEDIVKGRDFTEYLDEALVAGTPEYMAPEQISDPLLEDQSKARTDTTADVYALGVIFYQLLTGTKPFPFDSHAADDDAYRQEMLAYFQQRIHQDDTKLVRPELISPPLWKIIAKTLRADPKLRYGEATSLRKDILRFSETGQGPAEEDVAATLMVSIENIAALQEVLRQMGSKTRSGLTAPTGLKAPSSLPAAPSEKPAAAQQKPVAPVKPAEIAPVPVSPTEGGGGFFVFAILTAIVVLGATGFAMVRLLFR